LVKACGRGAADEQSIAKLERFFDQKSYLEKTRDIAFLRLIQALRSKGAAHAKGKDFDRLRRETGLGSGLN
jgi:hypothetical protein